MLQLSCTDRDIPLLGIVSAADVQIGGEGVQLGSPAAHLVPLKGVLPSMEKADLLTLLKFRV